MKKIRGARPRRTSPSILFFEFLEGRTLLSTAPSDALLLQLKPGASLSAVAGLAAADQTTLRATTVPGLLEVQGASASLAQLSASSAGNPNVQYVHPEELLHTDVTPNDPKFTDGTLWGLNGGNGIRADQAWSVTTGSPTVTVADIDTGIDYDHPDLYQNIWINQAEIPASRLKNLTDVDGDGIISFRDLNQAVNQGPGKITDVNGDGRIDAADILAPMTKDANGVDTGAGGWADGISEDGDTAHVDDLIGWNFVNNTNNPLDDHGHGTHTAGTIAAIGNNGVGVVGVTWSTEIMALKFLDNTGNGTDLAAAEAIRYAADHGVRVSNNSWGGSSNDTTLSDAITYAGSKGEIFVAAAGNSATNTDVTPNYPSAFNLSNIIAVAAISSDGSLASFSNYGATTVDLGAPGVSVYSTLPNNSYGFLSGTSMATPHVTGTVALVLAEHPTWTMSQVISKIMSSTTPDPALAGKTVTGGIMNAALAVDVPPPPPPPPVNGSTLWSNSVTPAVPAQDDPNAVELGVKFSSDTNGFITGIRFYKGPGNTGTHIGNLWSSTGALLATVTFTGESDSGWQTVSFASPVAITANTTYVASYHTDTGHYSVSSAYFNTAYSNGNLHAPASSTAGGNGLYHYGATGFPNQTFNSTNYWVDVVFSASATVTPNVVSVSPASGATGVSTASTITANFNEALDPTTVNSSTFILKDAASNVIAATVAYTAGSNTVTLTPSAPLANSTTYSVTILGGATDPRVKDTSGNALAANYSWSFTTVPASGTTSLWNNSATPAVAAQDDPGAIEVGVQFRSDISGSITGIRFYKGAGNTGTHTAHLWTSTGTLLATATFTSESASGWQTVTFASPVPITANTIYVASYHTDTGHYSVSSAYFNTGYDNGTLHVPANGGVYHYSTTSTFPNQSFNGSNYWVDVTFSTSTATTPTVVSVSPASGATGVSTTSAITANFNEALDPTTVNSSTFILKDAASNVIAATVAYTAGSNTVTLTPSAPLANSTTYSVTILGGATDPRVKDTSGNALAANYSWSFTTVPASGTTSLWNNSATPDIITQDDASSIELGVQFHSDISGFITGIKFYKGPSNTGTHTAHLWTSTGTLLATATFTSESASGWQTVTFASPVAITANTTYVASYHTNVGYYSVSRSYFSTGYDNGTLHVPANGGVYQYSTAAAFPNQSFSGSNYWVDVMFSAT